jgi:hypothetical protein
VNAKRCKILRRIAQDFAADGRLPRRQLEGGTHRIVVEPTPKNRMFGRVLLQVGDRDYVLIPNTGINERMSERGIYRNLKRDFNRTGAMPPWRA